MTRWLLVAGLAALNLVLGAGVYMRLGLERPAQAQIGVTKPDIAAVAGTNNGQTAVYMLDVTTGHMIVLRVDITNHRVDLVAQANVADNLARIP